MPDLSSKTKSPKFMQQKNLKINYNKKKKTKTTTKQDNVTNTTNPHSTSILSIVNGL